MKHLLACALLTSAFCTNAQWSSSYADVDQDGCIGVGDVLEVLSLFGDCSSTWQCGDTLEYDNYWYETVLIGEQCWFAENLRTTVYGNGDAIPASLTDGDWTSTTSGATAMYGEGSSTCLNYSPDIDACDETQSLAEYGRLYNWYAVDDAHGLCPSGWHVPTDGEWTDLKNYITSHGFSGTEGTALKTTYGWSNVGNGTDDFGFSAFPGGVRDFSSGLFGIAGNNGYWWSSSPMANGTNARNMWLGTGELTIYQSGSPFGIGLSVRCLKDSE